MGSPSQEHRFNKFSVGEIDVYLENVIQSRGNKIQISMGKFLWKKHINVKGISIM